MLSLAIAGIVNVGIDIPGFGGTPAEDLYI